MPTAPPADNSRPCPVCAGVRMRHAMLRGDLTLDYCARCGGVWFDRGEAAALRDIPPVAARGGYLMPCRGCGAEMDRDAEACDACRRENVPGLSLLHYAS